MPFTWDQLLPLAGSVGNAIYNVIQGSRSSDALDAIDKAKTLKDFETLQAPEGIHDPQMMKSINTERQNKLDALRTLDATPKLNQLMSDYQNITGTSNPRFFGDQASVDELVKAGLKMPDSSQNPMIATGIQSFQKSGQTADALNNAFRQAQDTGKIDPDYMTSITMDSKIAKAFDDTAQGLERFVKDQRAEQKMANEARQLSDFGRANQLAAENLGFIGNGTNKEDYLSSAEIRDLTGNQLAKFALTPEQRNSINTNLDKGMSDKWLAEYTKTPKGRVLSQVNPYTGEKKEKVENTTIIHNGSAAPASKGVNNMVTITYPSPDGRYITQDIDPSDQLNSGIVRDIVAKANRGVPGYVATVPKVDKQGNVTYKTYGKDPTQRVTSIDLKTGNTVSRNERINNGPQEIIKTVTRDKNGKLVIQ